MRPAPSSPSRPARPPTLPEERPEPRFRRWAIRILRTLFAMTILAAALWIIWREIRDTPPEQIVTALTSIPGSALGSALALTLVSYACLASTEVLLVEAMGFKVSRLRSALTSVSAFAASNSLGFSLASQGAVRLRGYAPADLSHSQIARLTLAVSLAVSLSGVVAAGLALAAAPLVFAHALHRPVLVIGAVALLLLTPAALWILAFRRTGPAWIGGGTASPPDARRRGLAMGAGLGDWLASGAALFVLLPQPTLAGFAIFLVVFVLGSLVSAASGVPGGLGVFEAVVISLTSLVTQMHETAAALLVYRLIYSLGPALLVAVVFTAAKTISRLKWRRAP